MIVVVVLRIQTPIFPLLFETIGALRNALLHVDDVIGIDCPRGRRRKQKQGNSQGGSQ